MRTIVYILLLTLAVFTCSAQTPISTYHGMIMVKENKVNLQDNTLTVDLNIDLCGLTVGRYESLSVRPMLRMGADSLLLPPIVIYGTNTYKMYERAVAFQGKFAVNGNAYVILKNDPHAIREVAYQKVIPFKPWMQGAQLVLVGVRCNYNGEPEQTYINILTDKLLDTGSR